MDATTTTRPRVAFHKFSSCDGCQLALLNAGEDLLTLATRVDLVHFAEAGPLDPDTDIDIALVEGSVSTPEDIERIRHIREHSKIVVAAGVCASDGGIQALRNGVDSRGWVAEIYSHPEAISTLRDSTPASAYIKVDHEIWGCPPNSQQVIGLINSLLVGAGPREAPDKVCTECKRHDYGCVLVTRGIPCMGPVTRAGCGALCPSLGRDCYGCYGPAATDNTDALIARFREFGLSTEALIQRFQSINSQAPAFREAADKLRSRGDD